MSGVTPNSCAANGRAGAAEAGDHLVEYQQDAVPVADLAQALEVAARRDQHAGGAGDRLDDHRGDVGGIVQRDSRSSSSASSRAVLRRPREKAFAPGRACAAGDRRRAAARRPDLAVRRDAAHRDAAEAHAVVAALAADQARARAFAAHAVVGERDLQRRVDRLGAGVGEEHVIEALGRDLHQLIGECERARVRHLERRRVVQRLELRCATASVISRRPWPAFTHHSPATPSRICRPSGVQ